MNTSEFIANREFREDIKIARLKSHMTQKELAEKSGLSISTICNIENPDKYIEFISLLKYLDAIGYELNINKKLDCMCDD